MCLVSPKQIGPHYKKNIPNGKYNQTEFKNVQILNLNKLKEQLGDIMPPQWVLHQLGLFGLS